MTLSKSDVEELDHINNYRLFIGQLMWYTTKVRPQVEKAARDLAVHMSHPGTKHLKALGSLIGYLKGKETKGIIIRNPEVLKAVMCRDSNDATYKDTIKSVSGLVTKLGGTLLMC